MSQALGLACGEQCANVPFISFVIATYNEPYRLAMCLESLRRQLFTDFEVIVTDDGSDDPEVARVADAYQVLFVTRQHDYRGDVPTRNMPAVLNAGVAASTGAVIHTLQQDHILAPDYGLWLARCWSDAYVLFGLTARYKGEVTTQWLDALLSTLHLPDGEVRWRDNFMDGRVCLQESLDWRHTDGLDAAVAHDRWIDVDTHYVGSGQMWLDHILDLELKGLRLVINPFMRLYHWEHEGRDTGGWEREMKESDRYFKKKRGKYIWVAEVESPIANFTVRLKEVQEQFNAR